MNLLRIRVLALIAAAAFGAATAHAQWKLFESDFDENQKEWKEIEAKIPPYPGDADLLRFEAGGASPHRFFIDAKSLSIGEDGVVRYTLVVKTAGGATNVTFEGVRCDERQQKVYALGHSGGSWTRARNPQWRRIVYQETNNQHGVLFANFLCSGTGNNRTPAKNAAEVVQRLKYGPPPRVTTD